MKILKWYTKNLHHPKIFAILRYIVEETIEFCLEYIEKVKSLRFLKSHHDKRVGGKGSWGLHVITSSLGELNQAHLYILNYTNEVVTYIVHHEALVKESNPNMIKNKVLKKHNNIFLNKMTMLLKC